MADPVPDPFVKGGSNVVYGGAKRFENASKASNLAKVSYNEAIAKHMQGAKLKLENGRLSYEEGDDFGITTIQQVRAVRDEGKNVTGTEVVKDGTVTIGGKRYLPDPTTGAINVVDVEIFKPKIDESIEHNKYLKSVASLLILLGDVESKRILGSKNFDRLASGATPALLEGDPTFLNVSAKPSILKYLLPNSPQHAIAFSKLLCVVSESRIAVSDSEYLDKMLQTYIDQTKTRPVEKEVFQTAVQ